MKSPFAWIYRAVEFLAGLSLVAILALILGGVAWRLSGSQLAGSDDLSGFCLVGLFFLGLAPAYCRADHIRVGLLVDRLTGRNRLVLEGIVLAATAIATGWATWWLGVTVSNSWQFGDVSEGLLPVQLWIPELAMLIGTAALFLAVLEDLVRVLRGRSPSYMVQPESDPNELLTFER
ncbi:TRAP-type C4-dicarboxylate transport system, small permease component [Faunimonas pinastri]|uniref:TRAP transporter small permease protein n=1 Tax=Faunimonas pinastri TaxID=1855383 RepID=A0A1H9Q5R5_9HYPH|nr:TRAP transporter small permease subunit [Faunimonas pinastri]SER55800.1 TRAP-type C4-dicarboxylate transport system, small permease component [Faunimonas pinastri]